MKKKAESSPGLVGFVFAHPGHELLMLDYIRRSSGLVCILTDGSGSAQEDRSCFSKDILEDAGSNVLRSSFRYTDKQYYSRILNQDFSFFEEITKEIADDFIANNVERIVADAYEGFNPMHDLAFIIALSIAKQISSLPGRSCSLWSMPIENSPRTLSTVDPNKAILEELKGSKSAAIKRRAVSSYQPLAEEVARTLQERGNIVLDLEYAERCDLERCYDPNDQAVPAYEEFGRKRLAEGRYGELITRANHVGPIERAILGL